MQTNKVLRYILIAGIFITPIIPFIISPSLFFPFITGKNFTFRIIVEILVAVYLLLAVRDPEFRPKRAGLMYAAGFVLVSMVLATIFSVDIYRSFWSNFERMEGLVGYLHLFGFFLVASTALKTKSLWNRLFATHLVASAIIGLYSLLQLGGAIVINQGGVRVDATFGNATYLAAYMLFNAFFVLYFLFTSIEKDSIHPRWYITILGSIVSFFAVVFAGQYFFKVAYFGAHPVFSIVVGIIIAGAVAFLTSGFFKDRVRLMRVSLLSLLLLQLYTLYHTATRGAVVGFGAAVLLAALLFSFSKETFFKRVGRISFAVVVLGALAFIPLRHSAFVTSSPVLSRFASISFSEQTTESRLIIWRMSLEGFKERPLFGWGQENYNIVWNKNYDPALFRQEDWFDRSHDLPIDWLVMEGVVGFAAQITLLVFAFITLWKISEDALSRTAKILFTSLLAGYFIQNLFVFDNLTSSILFYSVIGFVYAVYVADKNVRPIISYVPGKTIVGAVAVLLAFGLGVSVYQANIEPMKAGNALIRAMQTREAVAQASTADRDIRAEESYGFFAQSLEYGTFAAMEVREQLAQTAYILRTVTSVDMAKKFYTFAHEQLLKQMAEHPYDARAYQLAGSFMRQYNGYDESISYLTRALELSPRKQEIMYELSLSYLDKGDKEKAVEQVKQAFDLAPANRDARIMYGAVLISTGNLTKAEEVLTPEFGSIQVFDDRIIAAFATIGRFDQIALIWLDKIKKEPTVLDYRIKLAATYLQAKNPSAAIAVFEQAIKDFPDFKAQGEAYISQIRAGKY